MLECFFKGRCGALAAENILQTGSRKTIKILFKCFMCLNLQMWKLRRQIMTLKFAKQIIADGKLREYVHKEKTLHEICNDDKSK